METKGLTIVVCGATGRQGGAAARALLDDGWRVRALTRHTDQSSAHALAEMGAEVIRADMRDKESLSRALAGDVYGVFSVQTFTEGGIADEVRQGKNVADAAAEAGVRHFVYSSVAAAERDSGVSYFESKWEIEQYIRSRNFPATILRPVFFMENLNAPEVRQGIMDGRLRLPLPADCVLQMIAVEDIGAMAAIAFAHPDEYIGKAIEIASDAITPKQMAMFIGQAVGHEVRFEEVPIAAVRARNEDMARMFEFLGSRPLEADIPMVRSAHPNLLSFEMWLKHGGWSEAELKVGARMGEGI